MNKRTDNEASWKMEGISWVNGMWIIKSIKVKPNTNTDNLYNLSYSLKTSDCMALLSSKVIDDVINYFRDNSLSESEISITISILDDNSNKMYNSINILEVQVDKVYNTKKTMAGYLLAKNTIDSIISKGMDEVAEDIDVDEAMVQLFGHTITDEQLEEMGLIEDSEILQE